MSLDKNWTIGTIDVARLVSGDDFPLWFAQGVAIQIDSVLDGATRYLDRGGRTIEPLPFRAVTDSQTDRDALLALRGSEIQLTSPKGYTTTAMVTKATPVYLSSFFAADLEFEVTF